MKHSALLMRPASQHKQQGITLIIGLIMLTVLTSIAITVANMATVDLKIVSNQQAAQQARAAAESGIDALIHDTVNLGRLAPFSYTLATVGIVIDNPGPREERFLSPDITGPAGSGWSARVSVQRMGDPLTCPHASLPTNPASINSTTLPYCVYFEIKSEGRASKNSTHTLTRGFYRRVGGST